jgi:Ca2+-binding EF-hand superfamily protein
MCWDVRCQSGYRLHIDSHHLLDNEFTQLMKGLQGERVRQAFKFLDKDQDGFIRPEEFKQIILVRIASVLWTSLIQVPFKGNCWT